LKLAVKRTLYVLGIALIVGGPVAMRLQGDALAEGGKSEGGKSEGGKSKGGKSGSGKHDRHGGHDKPLLVALETVSGQRFAETLTATGTLLAQEGVELQAETNGRVVHISFREGTKVRAGDLLVKLNDADLRASLERALRKQELAGIRERRLAQLVHDHLVPQDDYDIARSEMLVQDSEVGLIRAQIAKTEIRAPFDGVVGLRYVSEGAFVNATTRVATLQQIDRLKIDFAISERYAQRIAAGQPVSFRVAGSDHAHAGRVYAIDPRIDASTRTVLVRALCDNAEGHLLPGSFASLELTVAEIPDALLIPAESIEPGVDGKVVYVVQEGVAHRRHVQIGKRTARSVEVVDGLAAGDQIVVSGLQQMSDGVTVEALQPMARAAPERKL
jgi:membrane fusion protein (multidrug efflux system)